ncbi:NADPH:quinone reductase [Pseudofrankia sp. BMG5.36]|nr:NADPH:quinone reductase [Pseudofrankia sp. BMG5.36]
MRAVRVHGWGGPLRVDDVPVPRRGEGETLVRVEAAAVAHLDLTVASGNFTIKPELPYVGGVEGCGVVVESDALEPGTRVLLRGGGLGLIRGGTWAEYVVTRSKTLVPAVEGLSPELGACFFVPTTTAHVALHEVGRIGAWGVEGVEKTSDEVVVVAGAAGAVGSMVVQLALRAGCSVIGLVAREEQRGLVAPGAEAIAADQADRLAALAKDRTATLLVDTVGGADLPGRCTWVRPGGRAVLVGYVAGTDIDIHLPNWLLDDVALLPVNMIRREVAAREHAHALAEMLVSGDLTLGVESFPMEEAGRAIDLLAAGRVGGRAVIVPPALE